MTTAIRPPALPDSAAAAADHFFAAVENEIVANRETTLKTAEFHRSLDQARSRQQASDSSTPKPATSSDDRDNPAPTTDPAATSSNPSAQADASQPTPSTAQPTAQTQSQSKTQTQTQPATDPSVSTQARGPQSKFNAAVKNPSREAENAKKSNPVANSDSKHSASPGSPAISLENGAQWQAALAGANAPDPIPEWAEDSENAHSSFTSPGTSAPPTANIATMTQPSLTPQEIQKLQMTLLQEAAAASKTAGSANTPAAPAAAATQSLVVATVPANVNPATLSKLPIAPDKAAAAAASPATQPAPSANGWNGKSTAPAPQAMNTSRDLLAPAAPNAISAPANTSPTDAGKTTNPFVNALEAVNKSLPADAAAPSNPLAAPESTPETDSKSLTADWMQDAPVATAEAADPATGNSSPDGQDTADPGAGDPTQWAMAAGSDPASNPFSSANMPFSVTPEAPVPTSVTLPQLPSALLQQMLQRATSMTSGRDELTVQVEPANLGRVQVSLEMHHGVVSAHVGVENEHVRELLHTQMQSLRQSLEQQGVHMDAIEVSVQDRQPSLLNPDGQNSASFFNQRSGSSGSAAGNAGDSAPETTAGLETGRRWGTNTVEYFG